VKAIRLHRRGGPDELVLEDAPVPEIGPGDVLVRVSATGITPTELSWDETYQHPDGTPRIPTIPGHEVSGVVERVAPGVADLRPGDAVYGLADFPRDGAAAEFVAVRDTNLARKPQSVGHSEASSLPLSALTAWQAMFVHGELVAGQSVLIHAGAGGVGSLAVQLARWRGLRVFATASARDVAFVQSLGADVVIDYRAERFEDKARDVDIVFDTVGGETQERSLDVLRKGGVLVSVVARMAPGMAEQHGVRDVYFIVEGNREQLEQIAALVDEGTVKPIIAQVFPLAQARAAFEFGMSSHAPGKIVLEVTPPATDSRLG
jgi:NADPH:quinone reductase-like Zn-dependent oxidoreductase